MERLRYLLYDLKAPFLIKFTKPKVFHEITFKYFANGLGTFKTIHTNEPRSVKVALDLQNFGINRFLDLGASFGVWTLPFAKKMGSNKNLLQSVGGGVTVAVDAHSLSCEHLYLNSKLNSINPKSLVILNLAVNLENGFTKLYFPKYASNLGAIDDKNLTKRFFNSEQSVFTIDIASLIEFVRPNFVKIDIEGIDLKLAGRISELQQNVEVMSIEVTPSNLTKLGIELLNNIFKVYPFSIPITKEMENSNEKLKTHTVIQEIIDICKQTKKTNLFVFRNRDLAESLCLKSF